MSPELLDPVLVSRTIVLPSCEKKRSILWAEWLREEVLEPVPHRHVVLTMPRLLRPLLRRRRELLLDLSQCGAEALSEYTRRDNYYGFGNQTPTSQSAFTEADQQALEVFPSLVAYQNPRRTFSLALSH